MNQSRLWFPLALALLLLCGAGWAQSQPASAKASGPGNEIIVPANTQIPLALSSAVSTRTAYVGELVYCRTLYPIVVNNRIVIPVGSYVRGTVTQVVRPGHIRGKAKLGLRFDSLTLPSGLTKSFSGTLAGFAGNGKEGFKRQESKIEGEGTKAKDVRTVAVTGAEGAGIGAISGISGGHSGVGAAAGGGAGALGGLIFVLATRGKEIVLPRGTDLQLQLTRPLTFYRYQIDPPGDSSGPAYPRRDPGPGF